MPKRLINPRPIKIKNLKEAKQFIKIMTTPPPKAKPGIVK